MSLTVITAPSIEPVTVAEAKAHLNIASSVTDDDSLIASYIKAARRHGENITRRAFVATTFELVLDEFPGSFVVRELGGYGCRPQSIYREHIELPRPPLQSVTSIKYLDASGTEQTLDASRYVVDTGSEPGRVFPVFGQTWPTTLDRQNAVRIRYVSGWPLDLTTSPDSATTPEDIKAWLLTRVAGLYEQRESFVLGQTVAAMPRDFVDGLLDAHIVAVV